MVRLVGSLYNDAGEALASANVAIFPTSASADEDTSACSATATTTTSSAGAWSSTALAANSYDVRISSGTSIRWRRFADEIQLTRASFGDDAGIDLGTCSDIVIFNRSTTLCADVEVTGVIEGTSDHPGVAANSLIVSNITDDGDIMFAVSDGGHSRGLLKLCGANGKVVVHGGPVNVGADGAGQDVIFYSATSGDNLTWDASCEVLNITGTNCQTALDVLDGDVRIVDKLYLYDRGGEYLSSDGSTLTITGATTVSGGITSTAASNTLGATSFNDASITNVNDIALDSISADATDINVAVSDNSATALTIKQGSDAYLIIDTANSSESVAIGTGISGTAITLGHSCSEVTVADNLTVTGNLTVSGTQTTVDSTTINATNAFVFEGATADAHETTLGIVDPTADATINLPAMSAGTYYLPVMAAVSTTAVSSTPAELNLLDGSSANTVVNSKAVIYGGSGEVAGTLSTAAQGNVTSLGTLTALTVDDVAVNGKVVTMTGSACDTIVMTAGTNGTFSLVTTDTAAAAANIQITADGTVDIDSAGVLTLDSGAAINIEPASGSAILLDGTISIDAGVVTGATSITSTAFAGNITGNLTGALQTASQGTITTVGALCGGSIGTSFGAIDNGTSNITSGGTWSVDVDAAGTDGTGLTAAGTLRFGASQDLAIYHGGSHNYITGITGDIVITTDGGSGGGIILDAEDDTVEIKYSGTVGASFGTGGLNLASGDVFSINCTQVLSGSALASAVKLNNANWCGTDLAVANGGTNLSVYAVGDILYASGTTTLAKLTKGSEDEVLTMGGSCAPTWAAASSGPSQANQTAIECQTNQDTYVPPDMIKNSPGVAKAWAKFTQASQTMSAEHGIATIADGCAAGKTDFTFDINFSSTANYAVVGTSAATQIVGIEDGSQAADGVTIVGFDVDGNFGDGGHLSFVAYGDQ